ncbi:MAG: hypothetical protein ACM359_05170, partial [Bacillota bacterium]
VPQARGIKLQWRSEASSSSAISVKDAQRARGKLESEQDGVAKRGGRNKNTADSDQNSSAPVFQSVGG